MRWIIRAILFLLVLVAVAVVSVFMLPADRIARIASDQMSNLTGRDVTMTGDTTVSFYPVLGISTGKVTIANANWSDAGPMFEADSLKIGVEPQALWGGDIRITGLEAKGPRIHLERASDGRVNWELGVEGVAPSGQSDGGAPARSSRLALTLDRALIENATFIFSDHAEGTRTEMAGMSFDLRWPEYEGRATFAATLRPAGEAVQVEGYLDRVGDFIDGAVSDAAATIEAPGGTVTFNGRISALPEATGEVSADLASTSRFLAALGLPATDIPEGFGKSVKVTAEATFSGDRRLSLRDMALDLGGNRLTGAVDLSLSGAKPEIVAQLNAGALDLSRLSGGETGNSDAAAPSNDEGWSKAPIDASPLALANGQIALVADSIDLGDMKIGKTRTMMTLDRARLVFELREVRAYEALITGQFVMNNRSGLSVGGDMTVKGIDMESFLTDAAGITRFSGKADASLQFLGVGQSEHAIMNSLRGKGAFETGRGVIAGIDLDKLMRSGVPTGGTTIFDTMSASFTIENGMLVNDDLLLQLPLAKAGGKGAVGIGPRNINYLFTPVLLEGETSKGLAVPVRIKGPWSDPSILPDLGKAIDLNLADERKALEDEAEKEVRRAVEKELGVELNEEQSLEDALEDALKDTLKEEARRGLLKLLE